MNIFGLVFFLGMVGFNYGQYQPNWASIDSRPLPAWFDESKFGIFTHWGVYSVPSFVSEWFWWYWQGEHKQEVVQFMKDNYRPGFTYADFAPMFTNEFFNATDFTETVKSSGAKYWVITSKHHEGYTMWPSKYSWNWNSMDVGPKQNILGEIREAVNKNGNGLHMGIYYSLFEWFNPIYLKDKASSFKQQEYVQTVVIPQIKEVVQQMQPEVLWSDGDWEASPDYWNSTEVLAWLYNDSPVKDKIVTNDRWGVGCAGKHGGYYSYGDRFNPGVLMPHKWESCTTLDSKSWGFRRKMKDTDVITVNDIISLLAKAISCNGNLLLNIGPTHDGRIVPIFEERLRQMGDWLSINGEAVYATKPWIHQNDTLSKNVWYTSKRSTDKTGEIYNEQAGDTVVYALVLSWPKDGQLYLGAVKPGSLTSVQMLGYNKMLPMKAQTQGCLVDLSGIAWPDLPSTHAWVLKFQHLQPETRNPFEGEKWKQAVQVHRERSLDRMKMQAKELLTQTGREI